MSGSVANRLGGRNVGRFVSRTLLRFLAAGSFVLALAGVSGAAPDPPASATAPRLELRAKGTPDVWVAYGDAPAFGYGLSPQNLLTCLPPGEARDRDLDFRDFAEWAFAHGVTIVRSYPPSSIVGPRYLDLFERAANDTSRFDLSRFNDVWFARLREACTTLRDHGIFVHLQLWQAVTWKKDWDTCYYNPSLNVNADLVRRAGPGEFVVDPKGARDLVAHQREYVRRILEATGDLGNVFYDVMNEIGNGTGTSGAWVEAMLDEVEAWESRTGLDVLVGLNDEGQDRAATGRALSNPRMEIAFLDLGRYDEHVEARTRYKKPTFGIRNIDWNPETKERTYFAGEFDLSINPDSTLASRSRRMYWRLFMAKCQMCSGYADFGRLAYRSPTLAALDFWSFRNFQRIFTRSPWVESYADVKIAPSVLLESPSQFTYALDSPRATVLYLESTPGTGGVDFPEGRIRITPHAGMVKPDARFLRTVDALWTSGSAVQHEDGVIAETPAFRDDQVAVIVDASADTPITRVPNAATLTATREERSVRLEWDLNPEGLVARVHRLSQNVATQGLTSDRLSLIAGIVGQSAIDEAPGGGVWEYSVIWKDDVAKRVYESNRVIIEVPYERPIAPEIRVVKVHENRVVLWAAGNLDPDLTSFEWQRRKVGEESWTSLDPRPNAYLADTDLKNGVPLEYRVLVQNAIGLASTFSEPIQVTPAEQDVPVAPGSIAKVKRLAKPTLLAAAAFAGLALGALVALRAKRRS